MSAQKDASPIRQLMIKPRRELVVTFAHTNETNVARAPSSWREASMKY
jgi:hypothetical protein